MPISFVKRRRGIYVVLMLALLLEGCGVSRGYPERSGARPTRKTQSQKSSSGEQGNKETQQTANGAGQNQNTSSQGATNPGNITQAVTNGRPNIGFVEYGKSAYYSNSLHGKITASGEYYDKNAMTASHKTLPYGTICDITNVANGKTVTIRINDRCAHPERILDLSYAAAQKLDALKAGIIDIKLEIMGYEPVKK